MKAILISDHAKWCALMMNGDKTIEVRKGTALYKAIQKLIDEYGYADIYVYCTKGDLLHGNKFDGYFIEDKKFKKVCKKYGANIPNYYNGKVLFKFRCYKVEEIKTIHDKYISDNTYYATQSLNQDNLQKLSCLSYEELKTYLNNRTGYAIHISDLKIFGKPKELSEFKKPTKHCNRDCSNCDFAGFNNKTQKWDFECSLTKAPQSFCYVEVEE